MIPWYSWNMMQAFIGWADRNGLRTLQPETLNRSYRFQRAFQHRQDRVAVWCVAEPDVLFALNALLHAAEYSEAWAYLQIHSAHYGRIL